jgi:adenylosuccinate synthase
VNHYAIVDLQFGSTGKGLLAGCLALEYQPTAVVTAWGPNAGHTFINGQGHKFVHRMLANGIVSPQLSAVFIGPGSVIDVQTLCDEIKHAREYGYLTPAVEIFIHDRAAVVDPVDLETEKSLVRIGSTMKGTAAAMTRKIMREPTAIAEIALRDHPVLRDFLVPDDQYVFKLAEHDVVQVEGAQGFSLGLDHGMYPYTTSRNCTMFATLHACGIPYSMPFSPIGTLRTYPIRVANRFEQGKQVGTSGPGYFDQEEIKWSDLGIEPELTTVTRLPRRVFTFSQRQIADAIVHNRVSADQPFPVFLNFLNYIRDEEYLITMCNNIAWTGAQVWWVGTGPTENDVYSITHGPGWMDDVREIWTGLQS